MECDIKDDCRAAKWACAWVNAEISPLGFLISREG